MKSAVGLPPRVRESLVHLLSGKTKRATAEAMEISPHTVSDYHKQIFKHFGVKGRNELFAMMLSGGGGVFNYNGTMTACSAGNCVAPLFQGYVFAICDFQFAHGYAFISDVGATKLAQGYLALVVPDRGTSAGSRKPEHSSTASGANTGEQLGN